ncbi:MAG: DUF302 domain-containing protein [Hyphomicrobiales bacterium]|nr:DUF302 domain-containing protein [Hyphomicrobiales bacterium]
MRIIKSVLALVGLVAIVAAVGLWLQAQSILSRLDPGARATYTDIARTLLRTGDPAEATVWKAQVKEGLTFDDVDQAIKSVATTMNIKDVGALPLGDQVSAMEGKPWRKLKIYLYCNPLTAAHMVDYSDAFSAYLPCRVTLLEDKTGKLWIYTMNMDMLIYGGKPLPPALKEEALHVKKILQTILTDGAKGEF